MAVDVECYVEIHRGDRWHFEGKLIRNPEWDWDDSQLELAPEPLHCASYWELAAILVGFDRPVRSIEPYTPVVKTRGLPNDLSPALSGRLRWAAQNTSAAANWFTAREAQEFGWSHRIMRRRAMVDSRAASLFADCPRGFPAARWPSTIPVSFASQMRDGVEVEWLEAYAEIVPEFCNDVLPRIEQLGPRDQVRLVVVASW